MGRLQLSGNGAKQSRFSRTARSHHTNHLPAIYDKGNAVQARLVAPKTVRHVVQFETGNDVPFLFDDPLGKIAAQHLARIDADGVPILQIVGLFYRDVPDVNWAIRLQHLQPADLLIVVAKDLQKNLAARPGRKEDVVDIEQRRIVGNEITRFVSLELKTSAQRARPTPQISQRKF